MLEQKKTIMLQFGLDEISKENQTEVVFSPGFSQ